MAKKKAVKAVGKKKVWVDIIAPKFFNSQKIGETHVFDQRQAIGKSLRVNLSALTGGHKKQTITVSFNVTGLHDGKAQTEISAYRIAPSSVRRMMRRGKSKVEDSFVCFTADRRKVRIKPIVVTRTKTAKSTLSDIRKSLRDVVSRAAAKLNYSAFMNEIVGYKLQRAMFDRAKRVYPVNVCEIRWIHLVPVKKHAAKAAEERVAESPKEEPKAEKKEEKAEPKKEAKPAEKELKEEVKESAEASN